MTLHTSKRTLIGEVDLRETLSAVPSTLLNQNCQLEWHLPPYPSLGPPRAGVACTTHSVAATNRAMLLKIHPRHRDCVIDSTVQVQTLVSHSDSTSKVESTFVVGPKSATTVSLVTIFHYN